MVALPSTGKIQNLSLPIRFVGSGLPAGKISKPLEWNRFVERESPTGKIYKPPVWNRLVDRDPPTHRICKPSLQIKSIRRDQPSYKFLWKKSSDSATPKKSYYRQFDMERKNKHQNNSDSAQRGQLHKGTPWYRKSGEGQNRSKIVSMSLSKLLRHEAKSAGIRLDEEAYARLDEVLEWPRLKNIQVTFTDIQEILKENSKQRFSIKPNPSLTIPPDPKSTIPSEWMIRANQGHSFPVDSSKLLRPATFENGNLPEIAFHGTFYSFYSSIIEMGGLSKMTRAHIHFVRSLDTEGYKVISGIRKDAEILIHVDVRASLAGGISWWLSSNEVLLTEGDSKGLVPLKYFKKAVSKDPDIGILVQDGVEIKKLPESLRYRDPPRGKAHVFRGQKTRRENGKDHSQE